MARLVAVNKWTYGQYSSENYGAHCMAFQVGALTVYFSYDTPVAFDSPRTGQVVRHNVWGPTTGKHLNWIDNGNKQNRISSDEFQDALNKLLNDYGLIIQH